MTNALFRNQSYTNRCNILDQIKKMQEFKNWKELINRILIESGQFENPVTELKGESEIETYKSTNKSSLTEIRVGYLEENLLIYLQIFNPKIVGYNKFVEGDYFHEYDFNEDGKSYGNPGLEFIDSNKNGIIKILEKGLVGTEIQYVLNGKILKSIVDTYDEPQYISRYDFTSRNFFQKLFSKSIEKTERVEKREIELNKIFGGI